MTHTCKVLVVGGGVMGASVAWHLSKAGARVTLIDQGPTAAPTATAASFGWVGASASTPSDDPAAFALRLSAIEEFKRLDQELGGLPLVVRGALLWGATEQETADLIADHASAGSTLESLSTEQLREKEPGLLAPPALAAWAPDDFALEPVDLARALILAAQAQGAHVLTGKVEALHHAGGRVQGVRVQGQTVLADKVVLANGHGAVDLLSGVGLSLPIYSLPAVLMRIDMNKSLVRHLLCAQDLELRPARGQGLLSAFDYPEQGEAGLSALAAQTCQTLTGMFKLALPPSICAIEVGHRPMTEGKVPICDFVGGMENLFAVVAHPGVILAPMLGRQCAQALLA